MPKKKNGWRRQDFAYHLPKKQIAQHPVEPRDAARLLVSRPDGVQESIFRDLSNYLSRGDILIMNDTRVIPARLSGKKPTGGVVEVFLLREQPEKQSWEALIRASKPVRAGLTIEIAPGFHALVLKRREERFIVRLISDTMTPREALWRYGRTPLPPYITDSDSSSSSETEIDNHRNRYQTLFARHDGAVAAPTAGLHFTKELLATLHDAGVDLAWITLHVGWGTFQPVRVENLSQHVMHREWFQISEETACRINTTRRRGGRVIAVGTTSTRALETATDDQGITHPGEQETALFIVPGYRFRAVDGLITNFHLSESTLLMLVSAFIGKERMERDYSYAIQNGFRFYSYGDATFLQPSTSNSQWVAQAW